MFNFETRFISVKLRKMKISLYLETSVVGAYLDNGEPFRRDLTIRWWEHELSEYRPFSSILVQRELEKSPNRIERVI